MIVILLRKDGNDLSKPLKWFSKTISINEESYAYLSFNFFYG